MNKPVSARHLYRTNATIWQANNKALNSPFLDMAGDNTIALDSNNGIMMLKSMSRWMAGELCLDRMVSPGDISFEEVGMDYTSPTQLTEQTKTYGDSYVHSLMVTAGLKGSNMIDFMESNAMKYGGCLKATKISGIHVVDPVEPKLVYACPCCARLNYIEGLGVDPVESNKYYESLESSEDSVDIETLKKRGLDINWAIPKPLAGMKALFQNAYLHDTNIHNSHDEWLCAVCGSDLRDASLETQWKRLADLVQCVRYVDGSQLDELIKIGVGDVYSDLRVDVRQRMVDADLKTMRKFMRKHANLETYIPVNLAPNDYHKLKKTLPWSECCVKRSYWVCGPTILG
jgi:hypothetical protein